MADRRRDPVTSSESPPRASDELFAEAHGELRKIANRHLRGERKDHTLQPTALVHEAYLRLAANGHRWPSRAVFLGIASRVMRQVLVDSARAHKVEKRGGAQRRRVTLRTDLSKALPSEVEILDLDRALDRLEALDSRKARVVELRVFGGMTVGEAAETLGTSKATIDREWRSARAWLGRFLLEGGGGEPA
ncbi:MAG: ECF-type sigma factor [Acidobacteriota bacterium]